MKQGHYELSIKPTRKRTRLDELSDIGGLVLLVVCVWAACVWGF
jgi:hypothetical protein